MDGYDEATGKIRLRPEPPEFKGEWYSICSAHSQYNPSCGNCNVGRWIPDSEQEFSHWLWNYSKRIWRKWANRKPDQFLESVFPNLHHKFTDKEARKLTIAIDRIEYLREALKIVRKGMVNSETDPKVIAELDLVLDRTETDESWVRE